MKIRSDELARYLQPLKPVYAIFGEEAFLKEEAAQLIRTACIQTGYERDVFYMNSSENIRYFYEAIDDLSLFSEKKLLELRCQTAKISEEIGTAILYYLEKMPEDRKLLIIGEKLEASTQKSAWYTQIEE